MWDPHRTIVSNQGVQVHSAFIKATSQGMWVKTRGQTRKSKNSRTETSIMIGLEAEMWMTWEIGQELKQEPGDGN